MVDRLSVFDQKLGPIQVIDFFENDKQAYGLYLWNKEKVRYIYRATYKTEDDIHEVFDGQLIIKEKDFKNTKLDQYYSFKKTSFGNYYFHEKKEELITRFDFFQMVWEDLQNPKIKLVKGKENELLKILEILKNKYNLWYTKN